MSTVKKDNLQHIDEEQIVKELFVLIKYSKTGECLSIVSHRLVFKKETTKWNKQTHVIDLAQST